MLTVRDGVVMKHGTWYLCIDHRGYQVVLKYTDNHEDGYYNDTLISSQSRFKVINEMKVIS